jgi:hypothetical protein
VLHAGTFPLPGFAEYQYWNRHVVAPTVLQVRFVAVANSQGHSCRFPSLTLSALNFNVFLLLPAITGTLDQLQCQTLVVRAWGLGCELFELVDVVV